MLVICVNSVNLPLTIGKMYEVIKTVTIPFSSSRYDDSSGPHLLIKCDNDEFRHIDQSNFRELTIWEKRELKIKELLK